MIRLSQLVEALSQQKFAPRSWSANQSQYDWRTQKKGDHWKSHDGKWGARAQSGEVDYFPDEETAKRFAQHSHTGRPGTYVSGQFKEAYEPDKSGRRDSPIITPAVKEGMVNRIKAGSRVTIVDRFGKKSTGKAVMRGPAGWVLNMGGRYGTPAIASAENIIAVKESVNEERVPRCAQCGHQIKQWAKSALDSIKMCPKCKGIDSDTGKPIKEADQDYSGPEYAGARKAAQKLLGMLSPADRKAFLEWLKSRKLAREKGLVEPD